MRSTLCHSFRPACSTQATFPLATVPSAFSSSLSSSRSPQPLPSVDAMWGAGQRRAGRCLPHSTAGTGPASRTTARRPVSLRTSATQRLESTSWPTSPCGQAPRVASRSTPPLQVLSHDPGLVSEVPLCGQTRTLRYLLRVPRCCRQALELLHSYQGSQP